MQFVFGMALQAYVSTCPNKTLTELWPGWTVDASYFVLFGNYYVQRYTKTRLRKSWNSVNHM